MDTHTKIIYGMLSIILIGAFVGMYYLTDKINNIPIQILKDRTEQSVKNAIKESTGTTLTQSESRDLVKKMDQAWSKPPQYESEVSSETEADVKAKELAKKDKADTVLKEKEKTQEVSNGVVDGKPVQNITEKTTMKYTAVTLDKKNAIGVYSDLDRQGSAGVYYRVDRLTIAVGKKYNDSSIASRLSYDIVQW